MLIKGKLYRIDLDTAMIAPLTEEMLEMRSPLWSPDGASIALAATISETNHDAVAYILDLTSGKTHRALESKFKYLSFSWAPDGQKLAVGPGIAIVGVASLTKTYVPLPAGIRSESVSWPPDGETLAFESESGCQGIFSGEIYTIRLDGSQLKKVSNTHWFHCRSYARPQWSPDGATILSTAYRYKGDMDFDPFHKSIPSNIYAVDADGSHERNLNNDETTAYEDPVWYPLPSDPGR